MKIEFSPVTAVTCDAEFRVVREASVQIENGRLAYVGPADQVPPFEPDQKRGGAHLVVMPGLVNTHTHAAMTLLRGYADDMALEPWLNEKIWPFEARLGAPEVVNALRLAMLEMLRGGTTCFADMYFFHEQCLDALVQSGMRCAPGAVLLGFLPDATRKIEGGIAWAREHQGAGDGRITPFLAPHSLYTCDREQWTQLIQGARAHALTLHTHAGETRREVETVTRDWGAPPFETLEALGALEGPLLAAHAVHTNEREREIMAERGVRVAHNPQSNLKLASGIAPIADYLSRGITVGLAPDGTASNNNLDMWEEMRLAATLHKAATGDPTAVTARQALEMATIGGARALGIDADTGSLEAGKKADLIALDFDAPHLSPCHDPVSHLVYAAGASDVIATLVEGRPLFDAGTWTTLDRDRILATARADAARLARP